ncbi:hypothetical protein D3C84_1220100 [compost metagenome]
MPLDARQGQVEAGLDAGEVQLVEAVEQEYLLHASWQALQSVQQGVFGMLFGSRGWVLKGQQQTGHGQLLARKGRGGGIFRDA